MWLQSQLHHSQCLTLRSLRISAGKEMGRKHSTPRLDVHEHHPENQSELSHGKKIL